MNAIVAFVALLVVAVSAQQQNCPNFQPMANMDSSRSGGQWFGTHSILQGVQLPPMKCIQSNSQVDANGVFTTTLELTRADNNQKITKNVVGTPVDGLRSKLNFQNTEHPERSELTNVLGTDYDNYAVWATCLSRGSQHGYSIAVSSRQQSLSAEHLAQVNQILRANNIDDQLQPISRENC